MDFLDKGHVCLFIYLSWSWRQVHTPVELLHAGFSYRDDPGMSMAKVSSFGKTSRRCQNNWIIAAILQQREKPSTWKVSEPLNYPSHPIMSPPVLMASILTALWRLVKGHSDVLGRVKSFLPLGEGMNLREHTAQMCSLRPRRDLSQTSNLNLVSPWDWLTPSRPFHVRTVWGNVCAGSARPMRLAQGGCAGERHIHKVQKITVSIRSETRTRNL